jgi:type VI secretion system secreted protein VgrG
MALLGRDTLVTGPLPSGALLLETFQGNEALGMPYSYDLTLLSDDPNIPVDTMLGQALTIHLKLETGGLRYFNGIVTSFSKTGVTMRHKRYAVVLNPKLFLSDYTGDCRIFNEPTNDDPDPEAKAPNQDALKVVKEVLADRGLTDVEFGSIKDHIYRDRRFCVQYRETDYNFITRLLEEGIYYFFKYQDGMHTLMLADSISGHETVSGYESILYMPKQRRQIREEEHFRSLKVTRSLYPGSYTILRDNNYTKVRAKQVQVEKCPSEAPEPGTSFEDYDYPSGLSVEAHTKEEVQVRAQTDQVANTLIQVEGNTMGLGIGDLVTIKKSLSESDHNPFWKGADFDKKYLIITATYTISVNRYETGDVASADESFKASYTLLDSQIITKRENLTIGEGRKQKVTGDDQLQVTKKLLLDAGEEVIIK